MSSAPRVYFRERQILRFSDLEAEQQYLLGLAGRHSIAAHSWGIVCGLEITFEKDAAIVHSGLAIDGYGRELVVFQPVRLPLPNGSWPLFIYLYSCERSRGGCGTLPSPRFHDFAEIQLVDTAWPAPDGDPPLAQARAAGKISGSPPWPVLLATIRKSSNELVADSAGATFTRLHGSPLLAATATTLVRVGQEFLADPYHFRISTGPSAARQDRFAIDRDGNPVIWGDLILTSVQPSAVLPTPLATLGLLVISKPNVSGDVHIKSEIIQNSKKELIFNITFSGRNSPAGEHQAQIFTLEDSVHSRAALKATIRAFNNRSSLVNLREIGFIPKQKRGRTATSIMSRAFVSQPASTPLGSLPAWDDREQILPLGAADLIFTPPSDEPAPTECDCWSPPDIREDLPLGFIFRSGPNPPANPGRDIYDLHLAPKKGPPSDEFRLAGGPFVDGDYSSRVSIGQSANGAPYNQWLSFRGNGSVALPGNPYAKDTSAKHLLFVTGSSRLPPVKPDPRDPLYDSLLVLAFTHGVLSISSSVLKVFIESPVFIEQGHDWQYVINLTNLSSTKGLTAKSSTEILWTGKLAALGSLPIVPPVIAPGQFERIPVTHIASYLPNDVSRVIIDVSVAMVLGSAPTAGRNFVNIPVLPSPSIDLSKLLDPSTPSASFNIKVINNADRSFTLQSASLAVAGRTQTLLNAAIRVSKNGSTSFPATVPSDSSGAHVRFTVTIIYVWNDPLGDSTPRDTSFSKTVKVK